MADDAEKTEEPTQKKIDDAKLEGNVPRSQDASGFFTLAVAVAATFALMGLIHDRLDKLYIYYHSLMGTELTKTVVFDIGFNSLKELLFMIIPLASIVALSGIIAGVLQFGFNFTTKPIEPKLSKMDPIKGFGKLFSMKKVIEGVKITAKVAIIFSVAFYFLLEFTKELSTVINFSLIMQLEWLRDKVIILVSVMLILLFILGFIDLLIVRYQYFKDLKMSKQEIKDEYKNMEGDPQVKARIKRVQMEMAQKRMMQDIPSADVIITNPTHYSVAIRYDKGKENAPRIVAKGVDHLALKIREIGRENLIQIVENPPLARELYKSCDIDTTIPDTLYKAVAEVLAFVYQAKNKKV
ncbi:MAG TPA: flagellar biosynthesis protein FlhB [Campylobacterales bacterium]|nr:flagellar biosynthesis protein FlhB [Campylobacterales bacterium]